MKVFRQFGANKGYPQEPVPYPTPDTPSLVALENGQLVSECQDLKLERGWEEVLRQIRSRPQ